MLAEGLPFLRDESSVREFRELASLRFRASWEPGERALRTSCRALFGPSFRLPSIEEARALLRASPRSFGGVSALLGVDASGTPRAVARDTECLRDPRSCKPGDDVVLLSDRSAPLYCLGPAEAAPPLNPSDAEVRACVRAAARARATRRSRVWIPRCSTR